MIGTAIHWIGFVVLHSSPVWAITAVPMGAVKLGMPQGVHYESTLFFEVGTVALALVTFVIVAVGFARVIRKEY